MPHVWRRLHRRRWRDLRLAHTPCRSEFGFAVLLGENVQNMRLEPGIQPATRALVADHIMINLGKFIKNTFFKNPGYAPERDISAGTLL